MENQLTITDDVSVNKQILKLQRLKRFSARLLAAAIRMETIEKWTFDDLILGPGGDPIGVNDERGTGEERMRVLVKLQSGINSDHWTRYVNSGKYSDGIDKPLLEILSLMKTRRFLLACYFIDKSNKQYMRHLLEKVLHAPADDIPAHVMRNRLRSLNNLNIVQSIVSEESVQRVQEVLAALKERK